MWPNPSNGREGFLTLCNALRTFETALLILDFNILKTGDNTLLEIPVTNLDRNACINV